jgi:hypothetical protein
MGKFSFSANGPFLLLQQQRQEPQQMPQQQPFPGQQQVMPNPPMQNPQMQNAQMQNPQLQNPQGAQYGVSLALIGYCKENN